MLVCLGGTISEATAFPFLPKQRQNNNKRPASIFGFRIPNANNLRNNTRTPPKRNNNANNANKLTPTEMALVNLRIAKTDLEKKNTADALLQLQGTENILSTLIKNPNAPKNADNFDKALKDVREARTSINSRKLEDAGTFIADAIDALDGKGDKKKKN